MIEIVKGSVSLNNDGFIIKRGLTKAEFLQAKLAEEVVSQQSAVYTSYHLKPQLIGGKKFTVVLYFNQMSILEFMNIGLAGDEHGKDWDSWSEAEEFKKKDEHDDWLEKIIGEPPYKYPWGEIASNYDPRSGSSAITIRYRV